MTNRKKRDRTLGSSIAGRRQVVTQTLQGWGLTLPELKARARTGAQQLWLHTLIAFGFSQFVILLGAFVRIPLITGALGATGYGLFVIITSVNPVMSMLAGGLSGAARISVADHPNTAARVIRRLRTFGFVEALVLTLIGATIAVVGRYFMPSEAAVALAISISAVSMILPLAAYEGALEGFGRTALAHLTLAANTVVGVPLLIVGLMVSESLPMVVFATALGTATPFLVAALAVRWGTPYRHQRRSKEDQNDDTSEVNLDLRQLSGSMTGWSLANLLVYVADAATLGIVVGASAAAEYGLGWRILVLVTAVPEALGSLLTVYFAKMRSDPEKRGGIVRSLLVLTGVFSAVGAVLGSACALWGPAIGGLLSNGEVQTPALLYISLGVFGAITSTTAPLLAACAAHGLVSLRARVGVVLGVINVGLSVPLAAWLGSAGPIISSVICVSVIAVWLSVAILRSPDRLTARGQEVSS
ncbi:MAG: hypothetical protein WA892_02295 [Ornithinimicrobium sp.]